MGYGEEQGCAIKNAKDVFAQVGVHVGNELREMFTRGNDAGLARFSVNIIDPLGVVIFSKPFQFVIGDFTPGRGA